MPKADPAELKRGHLVRIGASAKQWRVESWYEPADGCMWLVCTGPLNSPHCQCGNAFYVGPKPYRDLDPITDRPRTHQPVPVSIVRSKPCR